MIRFHPERYPTRVLQKLHAMSSGPYKVLNKIEPNAYILDILTDLGISSTFNVEDLIPYHGNSTPNLKPFVHTQTSAPQPMPIFPPVTTCMEEIEAILED